MMTPLSATLIFMQHDNIKKILTSCGIMMCVECKKKTPSCELNVPVENSG